MNMDGRYRGAVLDLFHTLVSFHTADAFGRPTHEILGIPREAWIEQIFCKDDRHALGLIEDHFENLKAMAHAVDPTIPDEIIRQAVAERKARFSHALTHIDEETLEGLESLRQTGVKMGLISNAGLDEIQAWEESPLSPYFDDAIFSCHARLKKPDPEIYLMAARNLALEPKQCLYIGDGASDEHEGARRVGMTPVLLTRHLELIAPDSIDERRRKVDFIVRNIAELVNYVM